MIGPIDSIEFRMTSNTKHLAQLQYGASQYNYCLGTRSNASSFLIIIDFFFSVTWQRHIAVIKSFPFYCILTAP